MQINFNVTNTDDNVCYEFIIHNQTLLEVNKYKVWKTSTVIFSNYVMSNILKVLGLNYLMGVVNNMSDGEVKYIDNFKIVRNFSL